MQTSPDFHANRPLPLQTFSDFYTNCLTINQCMLKCPAIEKALEFRQGQINRRLENWRGYRKLGQTRQVKWRPCPRPFLWDNQTLEFGCDTV